MLELDIENAVDVTVSPLDGRGGRGVPWPAVSTHTGGAGDSEAWATGVLHLSPHVGTHLDLPWAMEGVSVAHARVLEAFRHMVENHAPAPSAGDRPWDAILAWLSDVEKSLVPAIGEAPEKYGLPRTPPDRALIREYLTPSAPRCLILDFTKLRDLVRAHLLPTQEDGAPLLRPDLSASRLAELVQGLCVDRSRLEGALADAGVRDANDLRDTLIFVRTGWPSSFRPSGPVDVFGPRFECWLAWFLHPYLDGEAARWLADEVGVWGVAVDCINLENPLYYATVPAWGPAAEARRALIGTPRFPRALQLAHLNLLWRGKRLIESVGVLDDPPEGKSAWRRACVVPFPLSLLGDGAFTRFYIGPLKGGG